MSSLSRALLLIVGGESRCDNDQAVIVPCNVVLMLQSASGRDNDYVVFVSSFVLLVVWSSKD